MVGDKAVLVEENHDAFKMMSFGDVYKRQCGNCLLRLFVFCNIKSTVNTINNTGFMDEFPYYCILFYGIPVSYTHLDVYKRQIWHWAAALW